MEKKKDVKHKHFVNDDPTKFDHDKMENLAKEALKKFKKLGWYVFSSSYRDGFESSKKCRC